MVEPRIDRVVGDQDRVGRRIGNPKCVGAICDKCVVHNGQVAGGGTLMILSPKGIFAVGDDDVIANDRISRDLDSLDRKSTRLNSSHTDISRMPSSA